MAIRNFKNKGTEDINYGKDAKEAFRILPKELHRKAQIKLARLGAVTSLQDLQEIRGNQFEKLKGERKGQYSIRINDQYRICFKWEKENAVDVEIVDYHPPTQEATASWPWRNAGVLRSLGEGGLELRRITPHQRCHGLLPVGLH